eukprot:jgi/Bigna1/87908/estExt_fgenesh1_pg.C_250172
MSTIEATTKERNGINDVSSSPTVGLKKKKRKHEKQQGASTVPISDSKSENKNKKEKTKKKNKKRSSVPSSKFSADHQHQHLQKSSNDNDETESDNDLKDINQKEPCIVITIGSSCVRIGRTDIDMKEPIEVPCCVAFKRTSRNSDMEITTNKTDYSSSLLPQKQEEATVNRKRKREEVRRTLEKDLQKRHKVPDGEVYDHRNCTTTLPKDSRFWSQGKDSVVLGEEALRLANLDKDYILYRPIVRGVCNVSGGHSIQSVRDAFCHLFKYSIEEKLRVRQDQWKSYVLILGIPSRFNLKEVSLLLDVLLKDLSFEKQYFLALELGFHPACAVDIGAGKTHISCVVDGTIVPRTEVSLDYGGNDIDETLAWLLKTDEQHHFPLKDDDNLDLSKYPPLASQIRAVKEKHCLLSDIGMKLPVQDCQILQMKVDKDMTLLHRFNMSSAALIAPRAFFQPMLFMERKPYDRVSAPDIGGCIIDPFADLFLKNSGYYKYTMEAKQKGLDHADLTKKFYIDPSKRDSRMPIHEGIIQSILALPTPELRAKMAKHVLLVGGSAMMKGLSDALEEELVASLPYKIPGANKVNVSIPKFGRTKNLSWKGAYSLSLGDTIRDQVIEKNAYVSRGISILREYAPFPI